MRTRLGESLPSIKRFDVPIEQATTPSLPALKAYTLGIGERRKGRELESIAFFNRRSSWIPSSPPRTRRCRRCTAASASGGAARSTRSWPIDRQKRVSERERLFITYQYHDRVTGNQDEAARTLETVEGRVSRAIPAPANALALIYNRFGRYDKAVAEATEALRRSPGDRVPDVEPGIRVSWTGRYADASRVGDEAVKLGVATTPTRRLLYQLGVLMRRRLGGGADRVVEIGAARVRI